MIKTPNFRRRLTLALLGPATAIAFAGGLAITAPGASAQTVNAQQEQSQNWSGYVVRSSSGQSFSSVSGSWVQPSASSNSTSEEDAAFWLGIGGADQQSQSLEQVGTAAQVVNGQTTYYAWYELVPASQVRIGLAIHPGDHVSGKVTVDGTNVTVSLSDQTTGQSFSKTLQMSNPDTSSAEWIAEAPAAEYPNGGIQILPLANFGGVTFSDASATAGGHTGSISDSGFTVSQVDLNSAAASGVLGAGGAFTPADPASTGSGQSGGATAGNVSGDGTSFSVSYSDSSSSQSSGSGSGAAVGGSGYPGYSYPGYGYGDPGYGYTDPGYGYGGGYPGYSYGYGY